MPIAFTCPHCQRQLRAPSGSQGKRTKCPTCGNSVRIHPDEVESSAAPEPSTVVVQAGGGNSVK